MTYRMSHVTNYSLVEEALIKALIKKLLGYDLSVILRVCYHEFDELFIEVSNRRWIRQVHSILMLSTVFRCQ
ncbi:hypothetical protein CAEBREN_23414 [Caenorhabditis brenneri]|uniref:Uncharacterized protein n=1 Tax=Caenorhabditis brenneri TaxID=135651 RepID=G0MTD3_CAEBE|nr:hypothetical protein CAEBREN_23414 [Caenorhabditis brenneri]